MQAPLPKMSRRRAELPVTMQSAAIHQKLGSTDLQFISDVMDSGDMAMIQELNRFAKWLLSDESRADKPK